MVINKLGQPTKRPLGTPPSVKGCMEWEAKPRRLFVCLFVCVCIDKTKREEEGEREMATQEDPPRQENIPSAQENIPQPPPGPSFDEVWFDDPVEVKKKTFLNYNFLFLLIKKKKQRTRTWIIDSHKSP